MDLCDNYQWNTSWTTSAGNPINSSDWQTTKQSLSQLRGWLNQALANNDNVELCKAACEVLKWGGVKSAKLFLEELRTNNGLVNYLSSMKEAMTLEAASLDELNSNIVLRFDSGLTKIHAFLSDNGLPIYDSRVAAAIAAFVYLYQQETGGNINHLNFPVSEARGDQIRTLKGFPKLYSLQVSHSDWAKAQVKLGWILEKALTDNPILFANEGNIQNRMHTFEASLFMIGYDLRCIQELGQLRTNEEKQSVKNKKSVKTESKPKSLSIMVNEPLILWGQPLTGGRVPTSHNFRQVITWYSEYRTLNPENNSFPQFSRWLFENPANNINKLTTANSYCYPLRYSEMAICELSNNGINELANNPLGDFARFFLDQWHECDIDEALPNCIADVFIVGEIAGMNLIGVAATNQIIMLGFAGTQNAANAILTVGRSTGQHFGFLDENNRPTEFYREYFN